MEATKKQLAFIKRLLMALDVKPSATKYESLDKESASAVIDDLKSQLAKKTGNGDIEPKVVSEVNQFCFGMCCKLICSDYSIHYLISKPAQFQKEVEDLYFLIENTRKELGKLLSTRLHDVDEEMEAKCDLVRKEQARRQ